MSRHTDIRLGTVASYYDAQEFDELLNTAERQASEAREIDFVAGMRARYERYGMRTFLSAAQRAWLLRIANMEEHDDEG